MKDKSLSLSQLMLLVSTRVALGVGAGLLLAGKLSTETRKGAGAALVAVGVLTTIPIAMGILAKPRFNGTA